VYNSRAAAESGKPPLACGSALILGQTLAWRRCRMALPSETILSIFTFDSWSNKKAFSAIFHHHTEFPQFTVAQALHRLRGRPAGRQTRAPRAGCLLRQWHAGLAAARPSREGRH